ncbi:OrfL2 [Pseudonocardia sp. Ae707_Ps1]|nr:OrfL2 [Pseudonocardia sp. Ae707_Ps1]
MVVGLRRDRAFWGLAFTAGWLTGAGFFQLYDGLVQHKVMGLHQIRYGVNLVPYDVTWNVIAVVLLFAGIALWVVTARRSDRSTERDASTVS